MTKKNKDIIPVFQTTAENIKISDDLKKKQKTE